MLWLTEIEGVTVRKYSDDDRRSPGTLPMFTRRRHAREQSAEQVSYIHLIGLYKREI